MAFTNLEMAVLSQLSYFKPIIPYDGNAKVSLFTLLYNRKNKLKEKLGEGFHKIIENLIDKVVDKDYVIVKSVDKEKGSGFAAFAIRDPNNEVTVVCRGTEGFSLNEQSARDVRTDMQIATQLKTNQQRDMEHFIKDLEKDGYDGYYFTGHSLGGNLAMHGAIMLGDPDKLKGTVTFNAPGFNGDYLKINAKRIHRIENKMTAYQNENDPVSSLYYTPGVHVVVEDANTINNPSDLIGSHDIKSYRVNSEQKIFVKNKTGTKNPLIDSVLPYYTNIIFNLPIVRNYRVLCTIIDYTMSLPSKAINYIISKFQASNNCRDFSEKSKQELIRLVAEVENEPLWNVTRWDCWYHLDSILKDKLNIYIHNVRDYQRKMIDLNNTSVKDIERIFKEVYDIDSAFSDKLNKINNELESKVNSKLQKITESITVS